MTPISAGFGKFLQNNAIIKVPKLLKVHAAGEQKYFPRSGKKKGKG